MQPHAQTASDLSDLNESSANRNWPPNMGRLILAPLLTAAVGFVVLTTMSAIFSLPKDVAFVPEQSPAWMFERLQKAQIAVDGKNYMLMFGIIGAVFGASCVLFAFGFKATRAMLIGVVAAAIFGALGAYLSNSVFGRMRLTDGKDLVLMGMTLDSMKQSMLGYSLLWALLGLGVGIGVGSVRGIGKSLTAGISGMLGGVVGSMLYVILTAQFSIGVLMNQVVPFKSSTKSLWLILLTFVVATCIALGTGEKRKKS